MTSGGEVDSWELIQQKTFTRWVNSHVKKHGIEIQDLLKDLESGVVLCTLYEAISDEALGKYTVEPRNQFQKIANMDLVLKKINQFVKDVGIKVSYSSKQIMDGERRSILGMIWCLIHKFQIQGISESELSAKEGLLLWCQKATKDGKYKEFGVDIKNFSTSWRDGLAFCALIHRYRPDLINLASLDKSDAIGNLNLAFDIAQRELDILKLLDAEDLVNEIPDDKSVMTYLTGYWKKLSASDRAQKWGKKIGKIANKQKEILEMEQQYETSATQVNERIQQHRALFSDKSFEQSCASLQKALARREEYLQAQKTIPEIEKDISDLDILLGGIRVKQKSAPRFGNVFEPVPALSADATRAHMNELYQLQEEYDLALRDHIGKMKTAEQLIQKFENRTEKISEWANERIHVLNADADEVRKCSNKVELAAKLQVYDNTFTPEVLAVERSLSVAESLSVDVSHTGHESSESIQQILEQNRQMIESVKQAGQMLRDAIQNNITRIDHIVTESLRMSQNLEVLKLFLDDVCLSISEPVSSSQNVRDVQVMRQSLLELETELNSKLDLLTEAQSIHSTLSSDELYVPGEHRYSKYQISDIELQVSDVQQLIAQRKTLLDEAEVTHQQIEDALSDFEHSVQSFTKFQQEQREKISELALSNSKGSVNLEKMKDLLHEVQGVAQDILKQNDEHYQRLVHLIQVAESMDIVERMKTTQFEISSNYDTLNQYVEKIVENVQQQVFSAEQAASGSASSFTDEEMNDVREVFVHFDKDRDGALTKIDFKGACGALGEDIEESALDSIFEQYASQPELITFDEFVKYMHQVIAKQQGESKEDIIEAFKQLAKTSEGGITEADLRSVMDAEDVEFLMSQMRQNGDGTYDYQSFIHDTFGDIAPPTPVK